MSKNIKPLVIPPTKKCIGLKTYCSFCDTSYSDKCGDNGLPIRQCSHPEATYFKAIIQVKGSNKRKTLKLKTRNIDEAVLEVMAFRQSIKTGGNKINAVEKKIENKEIQREEINQPHLLVHALSRYVGFLNNEGVPAHRHKERSSEHIKDVERAFKCFVACLKQNGHNISTTSINSINDNLVGEVYTYLTKKEFANRTFNKYLTYYTSFLKWFADEYNYPIRNWFERINRRKVNTNPESITYEEYEALLKQIIPENGIKEYKNGVNPKRNLYRPWLADGMRLALTTGRRREEILNLKFSDIVHDKEGELQYIKVEDYKVNRIQNRNSDEEKKYIFIPITSSLRGLLDTMGYEENKNSTKYLLAPEIEISRKRIMGDMLSKGFSHYYNQLNTGRNLTFKSIRKAYITSLSLYMGGNAKAITQHSDDAVIEKHYIDKGAIAKAVSGFDVFAKETKRMEELNNNRTNSNIKKQNNREVE